MSYFLFSSVILPDACLLNRFHSHTPTILSILFFLIAFNILLALHTGFEPASPFGPTIFKTASSPPGHAALSYFLTMRRGFEPPCLLNSAQIISSDCLYNHLGTAPYYIISYYSILGFN